MSHGGRGGRGDGCDCPNGNDPASTSDAGEATRGEDDSGGGCDCPNGDSASTRDAGEAARGGDDKGGTRNGASSTA